MRKYLFYSLLMAGGLCLTTACGNDDNTPPSEDNNQNNGTNSSSVITMADAQNEIDRVGKEFISKIDAQKFKQVIELAQYCEETFFVQYDTPYPYDPYYPHYNGIHTLMRQISRAAQGDFSQVATKRAVENFAFSQYSGVFTWNDSNKEWMENDEGNDNELCYLFTHEGRPCKAIVKRTGAEYDWNLKDDRGQTTARIKVPETMTATITEDGKELASLIVNVTECNQSGKNYALNATLNIAGYAISGNATDNNTEINANFAMTCGNETLINGTAHVDGTYLADDNAFVKDEFSDNNVKKGTISATILNAIQLTVEADNTSGLYDKIDFDGYYSYYEYKYNWMSEAYKYQYSSKEEVERKAREAASAANRFTTSKMLFHNGTYVTDIEWEPYICYEYSNEWGTRPDYYSFSESVEWDIRPVLIFENEARYSFENYFTEVRFRSLINVFEDLLDDFESLER